jgi:pimeloyl-ACP methyl ester carboxylesterase
VTGPATPIRLREPEPFETIASDGGPLRGDLYAPDTGAACGRVALLCHGFRGYKDWGFLPLLATRLADEGIVAIAFNFASSGVTDREGTFGEPERFRRGTYAGDLEDLARIEAWAAARCAATSGAYAVGLAGHSRGGAISLLFAAERERVRAVVTLGAPRRIGVWPDGFWEAWRAGRPAEVYDFRTKRTLLLGPDLDHDWSQHAERYDTTRAGARLAAPLLVLQGGRDALVVPDEARELAALGGPGGATLRIVEGAGHSFQAGDAIRRITPPLLETIEAAAAWMRRWL